MPDFACILQRILEKFARIIGDELSAVATVTIPNGRVWQVGLTSDGKKIWFDDGNDDSDEKLDLTTPNPPLNSMENKDFDKCSRSSSKVQPQQSPQNPAKPSVASALATNKSQEPGLKKERAMVAARLFKPKNPSFMVIFRSADNHNHHFYVPAEFGHRYFSGPMCIKLLDSERKKWPAEISWSRLCRITRLGGFSKKLDEGDICVLELISRKKLKVSILKPLKMNLTILVIEPAVPLADQNTQVRTLYNPSLALVSEAEDTILVLEAESITPVLYLRTEREERDCPTSSKSIYWSSDLRDWEVTQQMAFRRRVQPSHFFKVILNSTLEDKKLRIPEKFVRIFGDELSAIATLTIPNGRVWQVGLTKDERKIWFDGGWNEFVQYHSIGVGHFLVFKYKKNSNFSVLIFDKSACETQYPYIGEEQANDLQNSLHQSEMGNDDSDEILDLTTPNPPLNTLKNKDFDKCLRSSAEVIDIKLNRTADKVGTSSDEDELLVLLENMGICVTKRFRNIAAEERDRAVVAAGLFKPKNPSFMVIWRSSDIHNHRFYVPAEFGLRYFNRPGCIKLLDSEGKKWPVEITWSPLCFITRLGGFSKKLDEGDVCVLELISQKQLKVSILKCG
ncbi:hypothetical protein JRO89_XS02G0056500 [Xanthoceras sorbifolium]|uniref:TF-B3 domain-containing protein n=1 Tax=Xanthoceras sorbifolium TaxID=99658 RepID=A0ABQ8IER0_9ROSI|nr:hypothetical protein JRO89_XS02G0056500 [Xanthoceras sorbifolium]